MRRGRREARRPRARAATARRRSRTGFVAAPAQRRSKACPGGGQGAIIARSTLREARRLDALVLDARYVSALTVVRSLGRRGVRVAAAERRDRRGRGVLGFASRYACARLAMPDPWADAPAFAAWLKRAAAGRPVFPVATDTVRWFAQHRPLWAAAVRALVPPPEALAAAEDKGRVHETARALGLPTPRQFSLDEAAPLPAVVKYRAGEALGLAPAQRYRVVRSRAALVAAWAEFAARQPEPLIQEYLPGAGFGYSTVLSPPGRPVAHFIHRRLREYPPGGGPSSYAVSTREPELVAMSVRLLQTLGLVGPAMVEWKQDAAGAFRLLEVNPRFWGTLPLAVAAGVDFPWLAYQVLTGAEPDSAAYGVGIRLRYVLKDFLAARAAGIGPLAYLRECRAQPWTEAVWARDDPLPAATYLSGQLRRRLGHREAQI